MGEGEAYEILLVDWDGSRNRIVSVNFNRSPPTTCDHPHYLVEPGYVVDGLHRATPLAAQRVPAPAGMVCDMATADQMLRAEVEIAGGGPPSPSLRNVK